MPFEHVGWGIGRGAVECKNVCCYCVSLVFSFALTVETLTVLSVHKRNHKTTGKTQKHGRASRVKHDKWWKTQIGMHKNKEKTKQKQKQNHAKCVKKENREKKNE